MSPLDRLLRDEMNRLLDRLAADWPEGPAPALAEEDPPLDARIDEVDARLASLRESLLEGYRRWRESLQTMEDLWALQRLKVDRSRAVPERRAA